MDGVRRACSAPVKDRLGLRDLLHGFMASEWNAVSEQVANLCLVTDFRKALQSGEVDKVKRCLAKDASLASKSDEKGLTPLMAASESSASKTLALALLEARAEVNAQHPVAGYTALMFAARNKKMDMINVLLGAGADADIKTAKGVTACDIAMAANHDDIAAVLKPSVGLPSIASAFLTIIRSSDPKAIALAIRNNLKEWLLGLIFLIWILYTAFRVISTGTGEADAVANASIAAASTLPSNEV